MVTNMIQKQLYSSWYTGWPEKVNHKLLSLSSPNICTI